MSVKAISDVSFMVALSLLQTDFGVSEEHVASILRRDHFHVQNFAQIVRMLDSGASGFQTTSITLKIWIVAIA